MAALLNDYADLLFFHPRVPEGYFRMGYERQAILLPMKACKVLVPYPKDDALNLFQETVLKLLNCGVKDIKWLAEKLSLEVSLIEVVIKELYERKLITKTRVITETGKKILAEESLSYDMKTGYIFYDYVSKSYMDAFIPDGRFQPCEIRGRQKKANLIQFFLDQTDPNSPWEAAVLVKPDMPDIDIKPSIYDVLKVCRRQRNRARMLYAGNSAEERDGEVSRFANSDKVSLLGDDKNVYVVSYLVIPTGDLVNKSRMQVLYPFGEGFSPQLLEPIKTCAERPENEPLKKAIEELKKQQTSLTEGEKREVRRIDQVVVSKVDAILSEKIRNYPYVNKRALEVETRRETILRLMHENKGKNWEAINSNINDYILCIYRLLAAALIAVSDRNNYYRDLLNSDGKHNADTLTEIALQCGFVDEDVFEKYFINIKKGSVTGVHGSGGAKASEEVRALIALNLLEADSNLEHPFYELARRNPAFIVDSYKLTCLRDDGMHGNDIEYNFRYIEGIGRDIFGVTAILCGLTFDKDKFALDESTGIDEKTIKHRKEAENQVENLFTRGINRYSGLADKLVDLIEEQNYGEEYTEDPDEEDMGRTGESYPTYVAEAIELILKELCKRRLVKKAMRNLKPYTDEYGGQIMEQMRNQGFQVTEIPYYDLSKISKSFRNYKMGTMQTNFYAWYFSEMEQPDNMISEVAQDVPNLVQVISDAVKVRRHTGIIDYADAGLGFLKKELVNCINQLVDLMIRRGLY